MSDSEDQGGAGRREVAWRVFAGEYDDADFDYSESDEERAPNYVVTPTGARVNRLFVVGVLTEVEQVSDDVLRGRVVDPTGAFVLYAGQYQPDEMAFLESADPPAFVAVTGKARTFQPDDSDRVFTSIRPESINEVDADTRDRWIVQTAEQTLARVSTFADAIDSGERGDALRQALEADGVDSGLAAGIPLALDHYGTTKAYLADVRDLALDAARVVTGESSPDDVRSLDRAPDEDGDVTGDFDYSLPDASSGDHSTTESGLADAGTDSTAASEPATETTEPESTAESEPTPEFESREPEGGPDSEPTDDDFESAPTSEVGEADEPETEDSFESGPEASFESDADEEVDVGTAGAGDEMYEFDEAEREEVEEEYGLEFSSGTEVSEPGEADIETPDEDELAAREPEPTDQSVTDDVGDFEDRTSDEASGETGDVGETDAEPETDDSTDDETKPAPNNLEATVLETMREMNDGDGVERETLMAAVVQEYDVTPDDVESAIEDALMAGQCYQAGEDALKPI